MLSSILRTATEWGIIDRNPCDKVRVQAESTADKLKFFTPEQAAAFLQYIEQPYTVRIGGHTRIDDTGTPYTVGDYEITKNMQEQIKLLFNLAIYTGLRKGELLALKWSDIDFQNNVVQVSKAVTLVDGKQVCKTPKTKSSYRSVSFRASLQHVSRRCSWQNCSSAFNSGRTGKATTGFSFRRTANDELFHAV